MLYITYKSDKTMQQEGWHVGDHNLKTPWFKAIPVSEVMEIQADGDELAAVLQTCRETIPCALKRSGKSHKRVQTWYGDHAKFIFKNVVLDYENNA
jgi:hypothetical protein